MIIKTVADHFIQRVNQDLNRLQYFTILASRYPNARKVRNNFFNFFQDLTMLSFLCFHAIRLIDVLLYCDIYLCVRLRAV